MKFLYFKRNFSKLKNQETFLLKMLFKLHLVMDNNLNSKILFAFHTFYFKILSEIYNEKELYTIKILVKMIIFKTTMDI